MKGTLFLTQRGKCPIDLKKDDEISIGVADAFKILNQRKFEVIVICPGNYSLSIESIIRKISKKNPLMSVVLIGDTILSDKVALSLVDLAIRKLTDKENLAQNIQRLIQTKRLLTECNLVGKSPEIKAISELIYRVASTDLSILIVGESGTGKELVAKAIHKLSKRASRPFLPINAAAIAPGTLESELFGHEKGSFTGAVNKHQGFFEQAEGGTLFLDEIGELPLPVQAKLLRVLETRDIIRVGGKEPIQINIRLLCATNKDLINETLARKFRQDLYYRLAAVKIKIPPLRERPEDIPILIYKFSSEIAEQRKIDNRGFNSATITHMMDYHWPGNVRELKNLVENAILLSGEKTVSPSDFDSYFKEHELFGRPLPVLLEKNDINVNSYANIEKALMLIFSKLSEIQSRLDILENSTIRSVELDIDEQKKHLIIGTLEENNFDKPLTAKALNISLRTLYRKLNKYGIK
ncbi:sigma-54-dependent Fis family transcriptional regulator [bacterium]|nr:sigma-54-dependent Fis family transcriptional regulator [bacterium]